MAKSAFRFEPEPGAAAELLKQEGVGALVQQECHRVYADVMAASPHASRPYSGERGAVRQPARYNVKVSKNRGGFYSGVVGTANLTAALDNAKYNSLQKGLG